MLSAKLSVSQFQVLFHETDNGLDDKGFRWGPFEDQDGPEIGAAASAPAPGWIEYFTRV
jgi:hypothetical protein